MFFEFFYQAQILLRLREIPTTLTRWKKERGTTLSNKRAAVDLFKCVFTVHFYYKRIFSNNFLQLRKKGEK
jgi:hypothetical protein